MPRQPISVTTEELVTIGRQAGLAAVGVAAASVLEPARTVIPLRKARGLAGEMQFTYRNPERSTDPGRVMAGARSLVAGAWDYGQWRRPERIDFADAAAVARYSWHDHYHDLEQALQPIADRLIEAGFLARIVADTNALVDRNVAWSAGLGWYGKNSNLLLPGTGSWYVLGTVVTDADLSETGPPMEDGCGSCSQCIDDCPTEAIVAPGVVDATRCLAWIVQAGGPIPLQYRAAIGHRIYGCDDCQEVCPPNRAMDRGREPGPMAERERAWVDLQWILSATDEQITERHGRWYIADRNVDFIRRTALVVLGNIGDPKPDSDSDSDSDSDDDEVGQILTRYLRHENPLLRGHAVWAARRLGRSDLVELLGDDDDPSVQQELLTTVESRFSITGETVGQ